LMVIGNTPDPHPLRVLL